MAVFVNACAEEIIEFAIRPGADAVCRILRDIQGVQFSEHGRNVVHGFADEFAIGAGMARHALHGSDFSASCDAGAIWLNFEVFDVGRRSVCVVGDAFEVKIREANCCQQRDATDEVAEDFHSFFHKRKVLEMVVFVSWCKIGRLQARPTITLSCEKRGLIDRLFEDYPRMHEGSGA